MNPEAVALGALEMIGTVRAKGDTLTLAQLADEWMTKAQTHDGCEDSKQLDVKGVIASLAFVHDAPSLPFRRNAVAALTAYVDAKRAEMAADMAALSYVGALIERLAPVDGGVA